MSKSHNKITLGPVYPHHIFELIEQTA